MKNRLPVIIAGIVAVLLIGFVAYRVISPQQAPAQQTADTAAPAQPAASSEDAEEAARRNVPRIEPDELLSEFKAGSATIIDVRDADSFAAGHIPGAKHIPLAQVEASAPYLPKSKPIVAYCT